MDQHNNQYGNRYFPYQHDPRITNTGASTEGQPQYQSAELQRQAGAMQHPHTNVTSQNLGKRSSVHDQDEQSYNKRPRNNNFQQPYSQHVYSGHVSNNAPYVSVPSQVQGSIQNYSTLPLMPPGIPGNIAQSSNLQDRPWLIYTPAYQSPHINGIPPSVKQKPNAPSTTSSSTITSARQPDQPRSNHRSQSTSQPVRGKKSAHCSGPPYKDCWVKSSEHTACNRVGNGNGNDKPLSPEDNALYWTIHEALYGPRPDRETPVPVSTNQSHPSKQATSTNTAAQKPVSFSAYPRYPSNYAPNDDSKRNQSPTQENFGNSYVNGTALPHMSPEFQARFLNDSTHNRQQAQASQSTHPGSHAHDVNPHREYELEKLHHITQTPQTSTTRQSSLETPPIRKNPCQSDSMVKEEVESHREQDSYPHCADTIGGAALSVHHKASPKLLADALALVGPQTRAGSHEIQKEPQTQSRASSSNVHQSNVAPRTQTVSQQPENHSQKPPAKCAQGLPPTFTPGFRENLKWVYTGFQGEPNSDDKGPGKALNYSSGTVASAVKLLNTNWKEEHAYYSELGASMGKWVPK